MQPAEPAHLPKLPFRNQLLFAFLRLFFKLLYHQLAWSYDGVAWVVSLGAWRKWVESTLAFLLGHWLEEHFVARVVSPETLKRFDFLMERQGALVAFFLFVLPGFPKDYLCFILGLSHMSLRLFLVLCTVGRLPGTLMLTLQGAKVYQGDYLFSGILIALCLLLGGVLYYYREPLYVWLQRWDQEEGDK